MATLRTTAASLLYNRLIESNFFILTTYPIMENLTIGFREWFCRVEQCACPPHRELVLVGSTDWFVVASFLWDPFDLSTTDY
jgi:hypothetical protein